MYIHHFSLKEMFTFGIPKKHKWSHIYMTLTWCKVDDIKHPLKYSAWGAVFFLRNVKCIP